MGAVDVDAIIKPLLLKDLRIQCRQRGLSPAGSRDDLAQRLREHMLQTQDFALRGEDGSVLTGQMVSQLFGQSSSNVGNNYVRSEGQNVGNFLGDRPSSRVLAAPGGASSFSLGFDSAAPVARAPAQPAAPAPIQTSAPPAKKSSFLDSMTAKIAAHAGHSPAPAAHAPAAAAPEPAAPVRVAAPAAPAAPAKVEIGTAQNNYARPGGQNVGNFLTDKPSSRVLAPPGGASQISFG